MDEKKKAFLEAHKAKMTHIWEARKRLIEKQKQNPFFVAMQRAGILDEFGNSKIRKG